MPNMGADLAGKGGHIRTIPVPHWVKAAVDAWGNGFTPKVIWAVVKRDAKTCGLPSVAPHDLRRACARLCHLAGGELEQIQFLLGHVSI